MRKARVLLLAVVLGLVTVSSSLVVAPLPIWGQSQENQLDNLLKQGLAQYRRGQRTAALATFQQALALARQNRDRSGEAIALYNIGALYASIGQTQRALEFYQQALLIQRQANDSFGETITLTGIGLVYSNIGQPQRALKFYQQALPIIRQMNNHNSPEERLGQRIGEAAILNNIGQVYSNISQPQKALESYQQALPISREVNDRSGEATTLNNIGQVYSNIGQPLRALEFYQQALPILRGVNDRSGEAGALNNIGQVYSNIGQPLRALEFYQQALLISREVNDRSGESTTLNNIGQVYSNIGQPQKALEFYQQALPILREVNNRFGEATTLSNIGNVYSSIGQPLRALKFHQQALPIRREVNDRSGEATTLSSIGSVYNSIGQPQRALELYQQALPIRKEVGDRSGEATTLNNISGVYSNIGQPLRALEFYQQALTIMREVNDRAGEAVTLNNIGAVYYGMGQPLKAFEFYQQALLIMREVNDRAGEAATLNNIVLVYSNIGQPQRALELYQQALTIMREVNNRAGEASTLNNIGLVYNSIGQSQRALEFYQQALPISREVNDRSGEALTLSNIGLVYRDTNQPTLAIANWEQSSEITLKIRSELQRENRNQFLVSNQGITTALVDLLIDQNQAIRAYEWSNIYSTADLVDFNRLLNAKVGNPAAQTALDQWNQQNQQLAALRSQLQQAFTPQLSQQINDLEAKNRTQGEKIAKDFPEIAELLELKREDITKLQAAIPSGTVVVQPVLLTNVKNVPNTIALFVLTRTTLTVKKVPIDPKEFDQLLETYRSQLEDRTNSGYRDTSYKLYDILIKPIAPEIQSHSPQSLAIIATGKLRYLPFETLKDQESNQFLIQKYPVAYLTRLTSRSLQQNNPPSFFSLDNLKNIFDQILKIFFPAPGVFGIGNPTPSKAPLPGATQEVQAIQNIFRNSQTLIEQAATLEAFKQDAPRFPILHLATHGCFQPNGCPNLGLEANTILFANNQQFPIADAALLGLNTRLLVLSACQTAQPAQGNGEEISGLAYVLERAGARAVMATLWSVEDKATRDLMINFYQNLNQGQNKAQALQQAKIAQINRHPYFWSAFLLIGDPR